MANCSLGVGDSLWLMVCGQSNPIPDHSPVKPIDAFVTQATTTAGLTGTYYDNSDFTGKAIIKVDTTINKSWGSGAPVTGIQPTTYSVRWTGQITPPSSQKYTFFLSSSGGAVLNINGVSVVNELQEHSNRTLSATVDLEGGKPYDIRIDYYRNNISSGVIALEWQSPILTRRFVPSSVLTSTQSNLDSSIALIEQNSKYKASGKRIDVTKAVFTRSSQGNILRSKEINSNSYIATTINNSVIEALYRFDFNLSSNLVITDILTERAVSLGDVQQYRPSQTGFTNEQMGLISQKLILLVDQHPEDIDFSTSLRSQGIGSFICNSIARPLPACPSCAVQAENYQNALCSVNGAWAGMAAMFISAAFPVVTPPVAVSIGTAVGMPDLQDVGDLLDLAQMNKQTREAWFAYQDCVPNQVPGIVGCPPILNPIPKDITVNKEVNTTGTLSLTYGNDPAAQSVLASQVSWSYKSVPAGGELSNRTMDKFSDINYIIKPGNTETLEIAYKCPSNSTVVEGVAFIRTNDPAHPSNSVIIKTNCINPIVGKTIFANARRDQTSGSSTLCMYVEYTRYDSYTTKANGHVEDVWPTKVIYTTEDIYNLSEDCTSQQSTLDAQAKVVYKAWLQSQFTSALNRLKAQNPLTDFSLYSTYIDSGGGGYYPPTSDYCLNYLDTAYFVIEPK